MGTDLVGKRVLIESYSYPCLHVLPASWGHAVAVLMYTYNASVRDMGHSSNLVSFQLASTYHQLITDAPFNDIAQSLMLPSMV